MTTDYLKDDRFLGQQIGRTLKHMRINKQMSIESFSKQIGISKLTLINIEKGDANPTLSVIWKIANGLGVPITTLLSMDSGISIAKHQSGLKLTSNLDAAIFVAEPLFESRGSVELYKGYLKASSTYESEAHAFGVVEYVTVLKGSLIIAIDGEQHHLDLFDTMRFSADRDHQYINPTDELTILHFVISYPGI